VVNLDGAFGEAGRENRVALERILTCGARVQFGGGLRDLAALRQAVGLGVQRCVIGTAAIEHPELVEQAVTALGPERIAVAVDARQGRVHTHGWRQPSAMSALDLAWRCTDQGIRWIIYTNISRDGMGSGLDMTETVDLFKQTGRCVIASGGVRSLEDVQTAYQAGLQGVILGRALYEGQVSLPDALEIGR
jgi:phosphoribosylformimino-5-aminoimidazole carboxamide ribotide isomerase